MTLGQLNKKQQDLNEKLLTILNAIESTVVIITGEYRDVTQETTEEVFPDDGIIGSIERKQYNTEYLLINLDKAISRLNSFTYEPLNKIDLRPQN